MKYVTQADEVSCILAICDGYYKKNEAAVLFMVILMMIKPVRILNNRFCVKELMFGLLIYWGYPGKYNPKIKSELETNPPQLFIWSFAYFESHLIKKE
jgi:hypothetical protein